MELVGFDGNRPSKRFERSIKSINQFDTLSKMGGGFDTRFNHRWSVLEFWSKPIQKHEWQKRKDSLKQSNNSPRWLKMIESVKENVQASHSLTFIRRFVDDGSHFDARKKRRVADPFAGWVEAKIDPMGHAKVVRCSTSPLVVELEKRNCMQRLLTHTNQVTSNTYSMDFSNQFQLLQLPNQLSKHTI